MKQIFAGLGGKNALNIVFGQIFGNSAYSVKGSMMMKLAGLDDLGFVKGQIKSEWIYEVIDFPKYQLKNLKDFCPESFEVEYL